MTDFSSTTNQMFVEKFSRRICVSVYGRDLPELRNNVALAQAFNPGYIELRLDYLSSVLQGLRQPEKARLSINRNLHFSISAGGWGG